MASLAIHDAIAELNNIAEVEESMDVEPPKDMMPSDEFLLRKRRSKALTKTCAIVKDAKRGILVPVVNEKVTPVRALMLPAPSSQNSLLRNCDVYAHQIQ